MLYVDFISLISNLVHVSLYIILLFSVNEVVEMKMQELPLCASITSTGLEGAHRSQDLTLVTEANKDYKMQSF